MNILLISNVLGFYFGLTIVTALVFSAFKYYFRNYTLLQCFDDLVFKKYGILNVYENDLDAVKSRFFYVQVVYTMIIYLPQYC